MARSKRKKPRTDPKLRKAAKDSPQKTVRDQSFGPTDHQTICWQLGKFDWNGPWGIAGIDDVRAFITGTVSSWESMTWNEIFSATGGRQRGNNNHPVKVADLSKKAKARLRDIRLDDIEELISLRVTNVVRVYGIRDGRAFQLLWYDPQHDNKARAVYPPNK